jgi:hypothetical protein
MSARYLCVGECRRSGGGTFGNQQLVDVWTQPERSAGRCSRAAKSSTRAPPSYDHSQPNQLATNRGLCGKERGARARTVLHLLGAVHFGLVRFQLEPLHIGFRDVLHLLVGGGWWVVDGVGWLCEGLGWRCMFWERFECAMEGVGVGVSPPRTRTHWCTFRTEHPPTPGPSSPPRREASTRAACCQPPHSHIRCTIVRDEGKLTGMYAPLASEVWKYRGSSRRLPAVSDMWDFCQAAI